MPREVPSRWRLPTQPPGKYQTTTHTHKGSGCAARERDSSQRVRVSGRLLAHHSPLKIDSMMVPFWLPFLGAFLGFGFGYLLCRGLRTTSRKTKWGKRLRAGSSERNRWTPDLRKGVSLSMAACWRKPRPGTGSGACFEGVSEACQPETKRGRCASISIGTSRSWVRGCRIEAWKQSIPLGWRSPCSRPSVAAWCSVLSSE
jgi:hypothetical protein